MSLIKSTARKPSSPAVHKHNGTQPFFTPQTKLEVGKPGDKYEREADNVAEQVVQRQAKSEFLTPTPFFNSDNPFFPPRQAVQKPVQTKEDQSSEQTEIQEKPLASSITPLVQRSAPEAPPEDDASGQTPVQTKCAACEEQVQTYLQAKFFSNPPVQLKCDKCAEEARMQAKEVQGTPAPTSDVESTLHASRGGGSPMDDQTRSSMETGFGADFSGVRIHTGSEAVQMNKDLGAHAFTSGNDIYFNQGTYNPESTEGKTLLAHELTHTIQQGASTKNVQKSGARETDNSQDALSSSIQKSSALHIQRDGDDSSGDDMNAVYDALDGWTDSDDSATILRTIQGKSKGTTDGILSGVASLNDSSVLEVVKWMYSDMVSSDWTALLNHFITVRIRYIDKVIGWLIHDRLSGYTSENDSNAILGLLSGENGISGELLSDVLAALETEAGLTQDETIAWLFSDMTSVGAHRLSQYFFMAGSTKALYYAGFWMATKIADLVSGYTSLSDSQKIVENFERVTGTEQKIYVYHLYDQISQDRWSQEGSASLMEDMQQEDYERLRAHMPNILPVYNIEKNWLEWAWDKLVIGFDYVASFLEYVVCGIAGAVWGIITVVTDLIVLIWDLLVAIKNLLGLIVFYLSGGKFGRGEKEAVFSFFDGMGKFFSAPGDAIGKMWDELTLEASLIEGPFTECQQSFFWVSRVINLVVNIILIFWGGYGAAKLAVEGIEGLVKLVQAGKLIATLEQLPARLFTAIRGLPAATGRAVVSGVETVLRLLSNPARTINTARESLSIIQLAAQDEGYFALIRRQAGVVMAEESQFWRDRRAFWTSSSESSVASLDAAEGKILQSVETVVDDPARAEALALEAEADATLEKQLVDDLLADVRTSESAANSGFDQRLPEVWRSPANRPPYFDRCVTRLRELGYSDDRITSLMGQIAGREISNSFFFDFNRMLARVNSDVLSPALLDTMLTGLSSEATFEGAAFLMARISNNQKVVDILSILRFDDLPSLRLRFAELSDADFTRELNHILSKMSLTREQVLLLIEENGSNAITRLRGAVDRLGNGRYSYEQVRESLNYTLRIEAAIAENPDEVAETIWGDMMTGRDANGRAMVAERLTAEAPGDMAAAFMNTRKEALVSSILGGENGTALSFERWEIIRNAILQSDLPTIVKNGIIGELWSATKIAQYRNLGYTVIREVSIRVLSESGEPTREFSRIDAVLRKGNEILYREFKSSATASTSDAQTTVYQFLREGNTSRLKPFGERAESAFGGSSFPDFQGGTVLFERPP